jgi:hypothetical protein
MRPIPRRRIAVASILVALAIILLLNRQHVPFYRTWRAERAAHERRSLFELLRPVALRGCTLDRFGEPHDGGYLMCANLLTGVQSGYSYGISGYDQWGCDISTKLGIRVHQYDCFDTTRPACSQGDTVFHAECVSDTPGTDQGRTFDTIENQLAKNGDAGKRIVLKIDVEGAEWDSLARVSDDQLRRIDQLAVEFHGVDRAKYVSVVSRLKRFFDVAHLHFNNWSCQDGLDPFPAWAYEVLFVRKGLARPDRSAPISTPHPEDAPNNPKREDCQIVTR